MGIIERLTGMDGKQLAALSANAGRVLSQGDKRRHVEAQAVLDAVAGELSRRATAKRAETLRAKAAIAERVKDLALFDRVVVAFSEMPPKDWESEALDVIARHPGEDGACLARRTGRSNVGYMNLAVGTLCSTREPYLGAAPRFGKSGDKWYSGLLVDMQRDGPNGRTGRQRWTLKPEAEAALRHLGIVGVPGEATTG